jgi:caffeoyl-CoA O-methyltransferase
LIKDGSGMMGSLDCAQHFQVILRAMNARKCLEVGCFTGSTALAIALAIPNDGKVITCDITDKFVRQDIFNEAGVGHKVFYFYRYQTNISLFYIN